MSQPMFYVRRGESNPGWMYYELEKVEPEGGSEYTGPDLVFINPPKTYLILGEYKLDNVSIEIAHGPVYDEDVSTMGFCFKFPNETLHSHAIVQGESGMGIALNRTGNFQVFKPALPDDFFDWLIDLSAELTWD